MINVHRHLCAQASRLEGFETGVQDADKARSLYCGKHRKRIGERFILSENALPTLSSIILVRQFLLVSVAAVRLSSAGRSCTVKINVKLSKAAYGLSDIVLAL